MSHLKKAIALLALVLSVAAVAQEPTSPQRVRKGRVVILSSNIAQEGIGEWGFAALIEADGHRILFDTGARPDTVLKNAREMKINLSDIRDLVLSHSHADHTGGIMTLRRELAKENAGALSRIHAAKGIFLERAGPSSGTGDSRMASLKSEYERSGGTFAEDSAPVALYPGVWLIGPIPRIHPERNWSGTGKVKTPEGFVEDTIPEDTSMVLDTDRGLVVVSGCGHAGIINTLEYARKAVRPAPIYAALGGFHLMQASDETLDWTAEKLREFRLVNFIGAHCTGIEPVYHIRSKAGLDRRTCIAGGVGDQFSLEKGIIAGPLTR